MDIVRVVGGRRLEGTVDISGAKNAALPLMIASLLSTEPLILTNVPKLADVALLARIVSALGVDVICNDKVDSCGCIYTMHAKRISSTTAHYDLVSRMRASFWVIGPLLARCGKARVSLPGGCAIGTRPIDFYLMALEKFGARVSVENGYVVTSAPNGLTGAHIVFPKVSVGATHTLLMIATLAKGETIIENAACEPEVVDLIACLNKMGAQICGAGSSCLVVKGVDGLSGTAHEVLSDRIEAGTYAMATIAAGGDVLLRNIQPNLMSSVLHVIRQVGGKTEISDEHIRIFRDCEQLHPIDIHTMPFPGFPTDLQAQFMALMTIADGDSTIHETIFENRFMHVQELIRLGANIKLIGEKAVVRGVNYLRGAEVMATDLRASACLIIAGLVATGTTTINRIYHLDRGFEQIEKKLGLIGAQIERCSE